MAQEIDRSMDDSTVAAFDDLGREVYCILGIPIDAIDMSAVLRSVDAAAATRAPFVISTPNLNFLVNSQTDPEFRESLLLSDLCPADGMPIIWIARLMGVPIKTRLAGSDIFEMLKSRPSPGGPLKVFLFGATEPVAAAAAEQINQGAPGLRCVGR
jgi:N-acetylglucosaminyldiphosphoundecaprenol N-acetyl-beta-D-mannosaminyltransferase